MEQLAKFLNWVLYEFPSIAGAFFVGLHIENKKEAKLERNLLDSETKRKLLEDEIKNDKTFAESNASDVVNKIAGSDE